MIYSDVKSPDIIFLNVIVKPGSKEQKISIGIEELIVQLKSSPIRNKANNELIEILSTAFNLNKNQITIVKGIKSRNKILRLMGITKKIIIEILESNIAD